MSFQMPSSRYVLPSFVERTSYGMNIGYTVMW